MNVWFLVVTSLFVLVSLAMVLIILVQRPSGGGLAGAFGGAGGSGSDTVFGGRVGDALTWATVSAFVLYLGCAIALNLLDDVQASGPAGNTPPANTAPAGGLSNQPLPGDSTDNSPEENDFGGEDESNTPPAEESSSNPPGGDN